MRRHDGRQPVEGRPHRTIKIKVRTAPSKQTSANLCILVVMISAAAMLGSVHAAPFEGAFVVAQAPQSDQGKEKKPQQRPGHPPPPPQQRQVQPPPPPPQQRQQREVQPSPPPPQQQQVQPPPQQRQVQPPPPPPQQRQQRAEQHTPQPQP